MRQTLVAIAFVFAVTTVASPTWSAEYRKVPGQSGATTQPLRSTPDIDNGNGDVNTDPAMSTGTAASGAKSSTPDGNACRSGGGQTYPNANTDNPPGLQPCPQ